MDEIASLWRDRETVLGTEGRLPPDSPGVTVEGVLYHKLSELIQEHTAARTKPEEAAYRLFETVAPENRQLRESLRPIVRHWLQVTNWFMTRAHDSGSVDGECDEGRLLKQFEVFETALSSLVRSFFSTLEELDEILEDTNS